jgi:hypothetical protein
MAATAKASFSVSSIWDAEDVAPYLVSRATECEWRDLGCVGVEVASERTLKRLEACEEAKTGGVFVGKLC